METLESCFKTPPGAISLPLRPQRLGWPGKGEAGEGIWSSHNLLLGGRIATSVSALSGTVHPSPALTEQSLGKPARESATPKLTAILGIAAFVPSRERSQLHCRHTSRGTGRMRRGIHRLLRAQGKASRLPWDAPGTGGSSGAPEVRDWELSRSLPPGLPGAPRLGSPRAQAWGALVR